LLLTSDLKGAFVIRFRLHRSGSRIASPLQTATPEQARQKQTAQKWAPFSLNAERRIFGRSEDRQIS
jgi:hypothetical protein